jgi:hypothetical protein
VDELYAIHKYARQGSVVLIDDAREFTFTKGYPTLATAINLIGCLMPGYGIGCVGDIIMAVPLR